MFGKLDVTTIYIYISDRGCLGADSREPSPSSQNLLRVGRAHILESLKPEYYERAPPATLLTSGGPDATERVLELKIVIWTSLRNRLSSPAIDFLWVIYRS